MRNLLLASAAVIATFATVSGEAKADFWATLNINKGYVDGDLWLHDFTVSRHSSVGTANIGALTVNDNEEDIKVRVKGPVVDIDVYQSANNYNSQGADVTVDDMKNDTGDQSSYAYADDPKAGFALIALAGAASANLGVVGEQENEIKTYDDDKNRQYGGYNSAYIYVEDPFGGLLDCGCSSDDFYTANINYGSVSGDIHAGDFTITKHSSLTAANVGAATINSSTNTMSVKVGRGHHRR